MVDLLSTRKQIAEKQRVKELEAEIEELRKAQKINFNLLHTKWIESGLGSKHPNVSRMLEYAALIPTSTAEVERIFSTMKLICTRLRKSLTSTNLGHCIRVSKFRKLKDNDYRKILDKWLSADDTKSKKTQSFGIFEKDLIKISIKILFFIISCLVF